MAVSGIFHVDGTVFWAGRVAVEVIANFFESMFIPWIIRDQDPGEKELIFQEAIDFNRIKSGIAEEGVRSRSVVE